MKAGRISAGDAAGLTVNKQLSTSSLPCQASRKTRSVSTAVATPDAGGARLRGRATAIHLLLYRLSSIPWQKREPRYRTSQGALTRDLLAIRARGQAHGDPLHVFSEA